MDTNWKVQEWLHGTNENKFTAWKFPPPKKTNEPNLYPLSSVFFTTNQWFAKVAGTNLAKVKIIESSRILDLVNDEYNSDKLRVKLNERDMYKYSETTKKRNWQAGCVTGKSTIYSYSDPRIGKTILERAAHLYELNKGILTHETALIAVMHNMHRAHIDTICQTAKQMGYSGIFCHEGDSHTNKGTLLAQPILAIFRSGIVSEPVW